MTHTEQITTQTEDRTSCFVGQTTFLSSPTHSLKNFILLNPLFNNMLKIARQAGLEPATDGFGDRNSTN